jgi:hypothetical protein
MSDFWHGLVNYKPKTQQRYFVADCDKNGEVICDSVYEINLEKTVAEVREQLQEDLMSWASVNDLLLEQDCHEICDIVTTNMEELKLKQNEKTCK